MDRSSAATKLCAVSIFSSRVCEKGTKGCTIVHGAPSATYKPLEPDAVRPFLLGRTISALYVHTDDGAIDWIALDFEDGMQAEIHPYAMHGMEAGLDVEPGTRIRDIYKVAAT